MLMSTITVVNEYEELVINWIEGNFDMSVVTVEEFRVLPYGKKIVDCNGSEMVAFFDYFKEEVITFFPEI